MPTIKPRVISARNFTLVEMIMVIAMIAVLLNTALYCYNSGSRLARKHVEKAHGIMTANELKQEWRKLVHSSQNVFLMEPGKVVFTDRNTVYVRDSRLVFDRDGKTKYFALPRGMNATFSQENNPGEPSVLVLWLKAARTPEKKSDDYFFRLVATMKPEAKP